MAQLKEGSRKVWDYVSSMDGVNITANDIADATGLNTKQVNGSVTAFQKKGLMERIPAEIENEDGTHTAVKFIQRTETGKAYDPDAEEPEKKTE